MKFSKGNLVRVKNDLVPGEEYEGIKFTREMRLFEGCCFEIESEIEDISDDPNTHIYKMKNIGTFFSGDMLEPGFLSDIEYNVGDYITVKNDLILGAIYSGWIATESMKRLSGRTLRIINKELNTHLDRVYGIRGKAEEYSYRLEETGCFWTYRMFENTPMSDFSDTEEMEEFMESLM